MYFSKWVKAGVKVYMAVRNLTRFIFYDVYALFHPKKDSAHISKKMIH